MRKRKKGRKFSRKTDQRRALLKSLAQNLFLQGKIKTTEAKAKEVRSFAEKMITRAKAGKIADRRLLACYFIPKIVKKLIEEIAPNYKNKNGGYTKIIKLGQRKTDGAKMVIIELVK